MDEIYLKVNLNTVWLHPYSRALIKLLTQLIPVPKQVEFVVKLEHDDVVEFGTLMRNLCKQRFYLKCMNNCTQILKLNM